jgi:protein KTI12
MTLSLISDHTLSIPRSAYATAGAEKTARATLSAAVIRALSPTNLVIVDALSYIKGWRYQLYCEAKAQRTGSCVVRFISCFYERQICGSREQLGSRSRAEELQLRYCKTRTDCSSFLQIHVGTPVAQCRAVNEQRLSSSPHATDSVAEDAPYDSPVFDNLTERYEEPNGMTRWDSPLFVVAYSDETPPCDAIWNALIEADGTARTTRPNAATVLPTARPADALNALERASQAVVGSIGVWLKDHPGEGGGEVRVEGAQEKAMLPPDGIPFAQLQRLRRQFVGLYRSQAADLKPERMPTVFVQFLNDAWGTSG